MGDVERRVAELSEALRTAGLRLTHQRLELVREIAASEDHPDAETLLAAVRARVPTISPDTVYRTLATLTDLGLVARITATPGPTRYDPNLARHHHFICAGCGLIRDVADPALDALAVPASASTFGSVDSVEVRLRGLCKDCLAKGARR